MGLFDDAIADATAVAAEALAGCRVMDALVVVLAPPEALVAAAALNCDCALVMDDDKGRGLLPPTDSRAKSGATSGDAMTDWLDRCPPPT